MPNYYEILKVKANAGYPDIRAAYKRLALVYHPDRNGGKKEAEESFKLVYEAYKTLSNPSKRRIYDSKYAINKPIEVKYNYNNGGLYRSLLNNDALKTGVKYPKPVFKSKKRDVDFYLFWVTTVFVVLLIAILLLK